MAVHWNPLREAMSEKEQLTDQFRQDVIRGLSAEEKRISSKYFYDEYGDAIFQRIMAAPEYYLTNAENSILRDNSSEIIRIISAGQEHIELIELGAGDGTKTKHLLKEALAQGKRPVYRPVDISQNILDELGENLRSEIPDIAFNGIRAEYADVFSASLLDSDHTKCILFLGSNIGNLEIEQAMALMSSMGLQLQGNDHLLIGFDLKKDPRVILAAYNDVGGATRDFNLNLLHRINRELGGDIAVNDFMHTPVYDPFKGRALSYLVSTKKQTIHLEGINEGFELRAWEAIHLEISQKYDLHMIQFMADNAGLDIEETFTDPEKQYINVIFKAKRA
jgi:dimethylhistidine N-methyltransferase